MSLLDCYYIKHINVSTSSCLRHQSIRPEAYDVNRASLNLSENKLPASRDNFRQKWVSEHSLHVTNYHKPHTTIRPSNLLNIHLVDWIIHELRHASCCHIGARQSDCFPAWDIDRVSMGLKIANFTNSTITDIKRSYVTLNKRSTKTMKVETCDRKAWIC